MQQLVGGTIGPCNGIIGRLVLDLEAGSAYFLNDLAGGNRDLGDSLDSRVHNSLSYVRPCSTPLAPLAPGASRPQPLRMEKIERVSYTRA